MIIGDSEIIFENGKRYYKEDLSKRDYSLENTTPYKLIYGSYVFEETAWLQLIRALAMALYLESGISSSALISNFQCKWSKQKMFTSYNVVNFRKIDSNLYVNCNHTAIHSCWLIQDMFQFFNVDLNTIKFYIHRPPSAEPREARKYFVKKFENNFTQFLVMKHSKTNEDCQKILQNITAYINPILCRLSSSYNDVRLFENPSIASIYLNKLFENVPNFFKSPKSQFVLRKQLRYLQDYYKIM